MFQATAEYNKFHYLLNACAIVNFHFMHYFAETKKLTCCSIIHIMLFMTLSLTGKFFSPAGAVHCWQVVAGLNTSVSVHSPCAVCRWHAHQGAGADLQPRAVHHKWRTPPSFWSAHWPSPAAVPPHHSAEQFTFQQKHTQDEIQSGSCTVPQHLDMLTSVHRVLMSLLDRLSQCH